MTTGEQVPVETLFNPFDPGFRVNPYPVYERLLAEAPIYQAPFGAWVLSRYAFCSTVLQHPEMSVDQTNAAGFEEFVKQQGLEDFMEFRNEVRPFLFMDPPDHTRLRGLVAKAFTPRVVEGLRPRIRELVDELLDQAQEAGAMDIIEDLAYPLPITVICEMLGVPPADQETFKGWSRELARALDPEMTVPRDALERRRKAVSEFADYFLGLISERRKRPKEDLLSALVAVEEEGVRLTESELLSTCILLLVAGHETTVNLIGNGVLQLLRHPDQLALLGRDPSLARSAVEEVLRFDPPVQMTGRIALQDITLGDVTMAKGEQMVILLAAANRDPKQFDSPERFDVARVKNPHLAFSMGIHFCLGAPLARVEGQIALASLARRFPAMKLQTEEPPYKENIVLRGLATLPVAV